MSKILVTGGLGVVGTHLTRQLRERGHDVWVADLPHHHEEQYIRCDVGSYRQLARAVDRTEPDLVYHLAAEFGRWNGEDYYDTLWRTNAVGTKNLIRLQEARGFRMVFSSSSEVYGDYDGVMEESVMDRLEVRQLNDYAITKWVNEQQILNSAAMFGTETVRVRLFNTYGPGEYYSPYRSVNCLFTYRALHGLPYTVYLDHHRTSSYITDTTRTLANIVESFQPGEVYNIASSEYHDIKQLSDLILAEVGSDDSQVEYREAEPFTTRDKKVDVSKAERDLDHSPRVSLAEGVARTVAWMREVYGVEE
ncbi:MAG: NAD-dependent epimerase/dehydratase family protein [Thermoanaerobaculia bacterium]|nr:NAD-dependent epimerase/dehydratase family protein [Thermoanaerobaculia bacterium]